MRRPVWLGAGAVLGVGGTLWVEQRVRRRVRRAVAALTPAVAGNEAVQAARAMGGRVRGAVDVARAERRRQEADLWRRMGEAPPTRVQHRSGRPEGARRPHR
ncbi:MAG: hypothetical protein ACRDV8_08435 [Acidimicrobiales bacterium]